MFLTVARKTAEKKILTAVLTKTAVKTPLKSVIVKTPALTNLSLFSSSQAMIATQARFLYGGVSIISWWCRDGLIGR